MCLVSSSCSTDEEDINGVNGTLTVNGESFQVKHATISNGIDNEDVLVGRMFAAEIEGSDDYFYFTLEYLYWYGNGRYSFELIEGDITDFINVDTFSRSPFSLSRYTYISGKVFLTRDRNITTLEFKDFTFENANDWKCVVNGIVKYTD